MLLLGDRVWYVPPWLDRILPKLDVEGEDTRPRPHGGGRRRPPATGDAPARRRRYS